MFDVNCEFPLISMQKRCMGMYRDLWGCMGKHEDCREKITVFLMENEQFCVGNLWEHAHALFSAWGASHANSFCMGICVGRICVGV